MSVEILEIKSHLVNATDCLTGCSDHADAEDFLRAIVAALSDIRAAQLALDALDYQSNENLHGL